MKAFWNTIGQIIFSNHRDMFAVRLGSNLLLIKLGIVPGSVGGEILGYIFRGVFGFAIDKGVFIIDLSLDSLREGGKLKDFEKTAKAEYERAMQKNLPESEKQKIRELYRKTIERITFIGEPK